MIRIVENKTLNEHDGSFGANLIQRNLMDFAQFIKAINLPKNAKKLLLKNLSLAFVNGGIATAEAGYTVQEVRNFAKKIENLAV